MFTLKPRFDFKGVGVAVGVRVDVFVGVDVRVGVRVSVGVGVDVGVTVGVGVDASLIERAFCGDVGAASSRPEKISKPKQTRLKVIRIETNCHKSGNRFPKT